MCSLADSLDRSSLEMSENAFAENLETQDSQEAPDTMDQKAEGFPEEVANLDSDKDQAKHPTDEELPDPEPPLKKTKTDSESLQVDAELSLVLESDAGMISPGEVGSPSACRPLRHRKAEVRVGRARVARCMTRTSQLLMPLSHKQWFLRLKLKMRWHLP